MGLKAQHYASGTIGEQVRHDRMVRSNQSFTIWLFISPVVSQNHMIAGMSYQLHSLGL